MRKGQERTQMAQVFLTRSFNREFMKAAIPKGAFEEAIEGICLGRCTSLGHRLYKNRIASEHKGKRGAYRAISYYRHGEMIIFIHLFAKNDKANISSKDFRRLALVSRELDQINVNKIKTLCSLRELIPYDYQKSQNKNQDNQGPIP